MLCIPDSMAHFPLLFFIHLSILFYGGRELHLLSVSNGRKSLVSLPAKGAIVDKAGYGHLIRILLFIASLDHFYGERPNILRRPSNFGTSSRFFRCNNLELLHFLSMHAIILSIGYTHYRLSPCKTFF